MRTVVVIGTLVTEVETPERYDTVLAPPALLDSVELTILNGIWFKKFLKHWNSWITKNPSAIEAEIRASANALAVSLQLDSTDVVQDPIQIEAIAIASERIVTHLAAEGLPPPANLTLHATELATEPGILATARLRVEARARASLSLASLTELTTNENV